MNAIELVANATDDDAKVTLRDRFAMAAITGIMLRGNHASLVDNGVKLAYEIADAAMTERARRRQR